MSTVNDGLIDNLQKVLLDAQKEDGSFDDNVVRTAQILPGLCKACAVDLKHESCSPAPGFGDGVAVDGSDLDNRITVDDVVFDDQDYDERAWIRVNYTVWVGLLVDRAYNKVVVLKENTTMNQMMMIAAENDGRFESV
jgi:hypothetical protein